MDFLWVYIILGIALSGSLFFWFWFYIYKKPHDQKKVVTKYFIEQLKQYQASDIVKFKKIHLGYTNLSFYIQTKDGREYQFRVPQNNDLVNRENEKTIIDLIDNQKDYLYISQSGIFIKKWTKGRNLNIKDTHSSEFWIKLKKEIDHLHSIKLNDDQKILKMDYSDIKAIRNKKIANLYHQFLDVINQKDWVISHNDLNYQNIIMQKNNELKFIDFEWTRLNHPTWDIVNFCRESNLKLKNISKIANIFEIENQEFFKIYYLCICLAYQWAKQMPFSFKILNYRIKALLKIQKTFLYLKKYGF